MLLHVKQIIFSACIMPVALCVSAQVEISRPVNFTSPADSLNQIHNIGNATDSTSLLNFSQSTAEKIITFRVSGQGNYTGMIPFSGFEVKKGTQLHLLIDSSNTISPNLIFGTDTFSIIKQDGEVIPANYFKDNSIARIVFDSTDFRLVQYSRNSCPAGFVSVNDNYCIEIYERVPALYTTAIFNCNSVGATLCSWGEWYYACQYMNNISVFQMKNNYEFLDETSDHSNTVGLIGTGGCMQFNTENVDANNRNYRCCYRK